MLITRNIPWESLPLIFAGRAAAMRDEALLKARNDQRCDWRAFYVRIARRWHRQYLNHVRKYWAERNH